MQEIATTLIGSIHVLAAVAFVGGAFLMTVGVSRVSAQLDPPAGGKMTMLMGQTYTLIAWTSVVLLILTGIVRSAALGAFSPDVLFGSAYGTILILKIILVIGIVIVGILTTRSGLAAGKLAASGGNPAEIAALGKRTFQLGSINLVLGVIVVILAVALRVVGIPD